MNQFCVDLCRTDESRTGRYYYRSGPITRSRQIDSEESDSHGEIASSRNTQQALDFEQIQRFVQIDRTTLFDKRMIILL